jgi:hypothetical protein
MFKGKSSKKGPNDMVGITFYSEGAIDYVDWSTNMVADMITKIDSPLGGGSTFIAKREF